MQKIIPTVAIDFDGTIAKHTINFPEIGEPIIGAFDAIDTFKKYGIKIILWTSRTGYELIDVINWCNNNGILFDAINSNIPNLPSNRGVPKVVAQYYIDDKNATRTHTGDITESEWKSITDYVINGFKEKGLI